MYYDVFYHMFLAEMPVKLNGNNDFDIQLEIIRENLRYNPEVSEVRPGICKIQNDDHYTYWVGDSTAQNVYLIVDVVIDHKFAKIKLTSKNPKLSPGSQPYASDLYLIIQNDLDSNVVLSSDKFLSDDGEKIWKRLVSNGRRISVYDSSTNKYVLDKIETADQLSSYIGGFDKEKYLFVISETLQKFLALNHSFRILELKRLSGYPLARLFEQYRTNKSKA
jgi:hypothetical protein